MWIRSFIPQVVPPHYHLNSSRPSMYPRQGHPEITFVADPRECDNATKSTSVSPHPNLNREISRLRPAFGVVGRDYQFWEQRLFSFERVGFYC